MAKNELDERLAEVRLGEEVALIVKPNDDEDRRIDIDATATMIGDPFVFELSNMASTGSDFASSMACSENPPGPADAAEFEVYVVRRIDGCFSVCRDGTLFGELRSIVRQP
ncbi:hypothetical protein [Natronorubrum sp. A-ect3]|uniref:hypothetical protein n=1 Tax=Natronorubrum sp. A-ect3 TaxID=3242698 RepID=UPI00359E502C